MYLSAALIPPPRVTGALHAELATRCALSPRESVRPAEGGGQDARILSLTLRSPLQVVATESMSAHLTRFGYVAADEADVLSRDVAGQLGTHGTFSLSIGGSVRVDHARGLVLVGLQGETDRLEAVFQAIHTSVRRAGFVQDRKRFDPQVPVLAFRPDLRLGVLTRAVEALEDYSSGTWTVTSIALVQRELSGRDTRHLVLADLALGACGSQSLP